MDYDKDIKIDETALDVECLQQAELALKYGKEWADCKHKEALAEENIKTVRSDLVKKANADPDTYLGVGIKPIAANVEAFYRTHKKYIKAKDAWVEAVYQCNLAEIAKREISVTRKTMLENLIILHGQRYFAGPSTPRNLKTEREALEERSNRKVGEKLSKRNKKK